MYLCLYLHPNGFGSVLGIDELRAPVSPQDFKSKLCKSHVRWHSEALAAMKEVAADLVDSRQGMRPIERYSTGVTPGHCFFSVLVPKKTSRLHVVLGGSSIEAHLAVFFPRVNFLLPRLYVVLIEPADIEHWPQASEFDRQLLELSIVVEKEGETAIQFRIAACCGDKGRVPLH